MIWFYYAIKSNSEKQWIFLWQANTMKYWKDFSNRECLPFRQPTGTAFYRKLRLLQFVCIDNEDLPKYHQCLEHVYLQNYYKSILISGVGIGSLYLLKRLITNLEYFARNNLTGVFPTKRIWIYAFQFIELMRPIMFILPQAEIHGCLLSWKISLIT